LIDLLLEMDAEHVVERARQEMSACGAGAMAATISACRELGATRGRLLTHTTSAEVMRGIGGRPEEDAVGYAGVIFE
jgi:AmmeMemoRadiSam system protein B